MSNWIHACGASAAALVAGELVPRVTAGLEPVREQDHGDRADVAPAHLAAAVGLVGLFQKLDPAHGRAQFLTLVPHDAPILDEHAARVVAYCTSYGFAISH